MTEPVSHQAQPGFVVVALAGGVLEDDFRAAGFAAPNKAYLPIGGKLMLVRVLQALRAASLVREVRCVTQAGDLERASGPAILCDHLIDPGSDLVGSVLAGVVDLPDEERVLVSATDMPLLSPRAVDGFAGLAAGTPCDIGYGCVEKNVHERAYPSVRHTWVRLREGTFCGGGISLLRAGAIRSMEAKLRAFTSARKSPWKMASLFSLRLLWGFASGRLSISDVEAQADRLTGLRCRAIVCPNPEVAVNVDTLADLKTIEKLTNAP